MDKMELWIMKARKREAEARNRELKKRLEERLAGKTEAPLCRGLNVREREAARQKIMTYAL